MFSKTETDKIDCASLYIPDELWVSVLESIQKKINTLKDDCVNVLNTIKGVIKNNKRQWFEKNSDKADNLTNDLFAIIKSLIEHKKFIVNTHRNIAMHVSYYPEDNMKMIFKHKHDDKVKYKTECSIEKYYYFIKSIEENKKGNKNENTNINLPEEIKKSLENDINLINKYIKLIKESIEFYKDINNSSEEKDKELVGKINNFMPDSINNEDKQTSKTR